MVVARVEAGDVEIANPDSCFGPVLLAEVLAPPEFLKTSLIEFSTGTRGIPL